MRVVVLAHRSVAASERRVRGLHLGDEGWVGGAMTYRLHDGHRIEQQPQLVDLRRVAGVERCHTSTALWFEHHETFAGEALERLTKRCGRHAPLLGQLLRIQPIARRQLAVHDGPAEDRVDPFGTGGRRVERQSHEDMVPHLRLVNNL